MDFLQPSFYRQLRAARALLGWSQKELADMAGVSLSTLNRLERGDGDPSISSLRLIQGAFEQAGLRFFTTAEGAIGVSLSAEGLQQEEVRRSKVGD
jgi:transcriptional regulator with XRE-family HTH domain